MSAGEPYGKIPNAFGFRVRAENGTIVGNLGVINDGTGVSLALLLHQRRRRIRLAVDRDCRPSMQLLDADGAVSWSAP